MTATAGSLMVNNQSDCPILLKLFIFPLLMMHFNEFSAVDCALCIILVLS